MLNLAPYGLNWSIDPNVAGSVVVPDNYESLITKVTFSGNNYTIKKADGTSHVYKKGAKTGEGAYGKVYECERDGESCIVKEMVYEDGSDFVASLIESIIQIIVVKETESSNYPDYNLKGPFAPRLYDVAYDSLTGKVFIFAEKMKSTFRNFFEKAAGKDSGKDLVYIILRVAIILSELFKKLSFNHRDFKSDNCMYIRDASGNMLPRVIDFGFSCIKYKQLTINAKPDRFRYCNVEGRDMSHFIYECIHYNPKIPKETLPVF